MISRRLFNDLDEINEWRAKEGKDVKIINIDYSEPARAYLSVWFECNEKEGHNKTDVHPIRDDSRSAVSVPVNILLKNGCNYKGHFDYYKDVWVIEIENDQVKGWGYI